MLVEIVDKEGIVLPNDNREVSFSVTGPADIIAIGNADIKDTTSYVSNPHKVWKGRCLVVLRNNGKKGHSVLTARASGLPESKTIITSK